MLVDYTEGTQAFMQLNRTTEVDGALSAKYKQLIQLGISLYARCESCIVLHTMQAFHAGATRNEIIETCGAALAMGGSPVMFGISVVLDTIETFDQD